ncbi:MAG: hypothetical protein NC341_09510 [Blautia sp.]|nr:hypothetical protein [Blautia sp.]MCM1201425.1 hypothetical protein [Bacteroides fragilis]
MNEDLRKKEYSDIDFGFAEPEAGGGSPFDAVKDTLRNATSIGAATQAGLQTASLQAAIDGYARAMNQSAIARTTGLPVKTSSVQYKGFAAEEYFKHTLKINALAKGVPDYKLGVYTKGAMPDGSILSGTDMETDISIWTREQPWSKPARTADYQSKIHDDPAAYAKDMANPQYENVDFVGGAGQGVNDRIRVTVDNKTIASDAITPEEATELADAMKAQETPEYRKAAEKHGELNKVNLGRAVAAGAASGLLLTTIKEIAGVIRNRDNLSEDQFVESIMHILCGTAEGGVRGGAIMGSVQLLGKAVGREIAANTLGAVPPMAAANTAVDFAKDLYRCFVAETIDADDLLCNTVNNTFSSFAGFGGAYLGGQLAGFVSAQTAAAAGAAIGSAIGPIGTMIGSIAGGMIIGLGANAIISAADRDAGKAFNECIAEINTHIELNGCAKLYYFADSMSGLSDFRLSFRDLLPCYNLISDLREYNLRKKAVRSIHEQLDASLAGIETARADALRRLEAQHNNRLRELQSLFYEQREMMKGEFRDSMNTYIASSYSQYLGLFDVLSGDIRRLKAELDDNTAAHNAILDYARSRNRVNAQLNETLAEIISDPDSSHLLRPFVKKLEEFMQQDVLIVGKQYLSYDEALFLVKGGSL